MADHRDRRTPKTPPTGVANQLAPPPGETWAGDTGSAVRIDEDTPVGLETLDAEADARVRHRVKETNTDVKSVKETAEATRTGIDTLRFETKKDVHRLETKIGAVDQKVGLLDTKIDQHTLSVTGHVIRMVEVVGELKGQVGELVKSTDAGRERQQITFEAHVDVAKTAKVTEIADAADSKKMQRERWANVLKIFAALVGLATAAFAAGRC
jgi:hypothetical protein